ncbi:FecR domain-containing protein [Pseudomonas sp. SWRI18]|uniref:FecR domain-containing protein n=1 Tax=Pseudomonas sp. SWRI18 TaxID=2753888 RepID=UPI0016490CFA|nr:FecR domain-containing protein [Pseudomonas sp. SWRI18]MBC3301381.1 FecR domain-containing protein [Pseudomonas sp. SWRI18]
MTPSIDPQILGEAADWMVQLQSGSATDDDRRAIAQWQGRSAQHALAWQRAQAILEDFDSVPAAIAGDTLKRIGRKKSLGRRQALGLLLLAGPASWLAYRQKPWQPWTADQHTAVGEQRNVSLPDGTHLLINTASSLNIAFTDQVRRIDLLQGEVKVTTAKDPAPTHRPFIVQTRHGTARALGTHFSVRVDEQSSRVAVLEGAVEMLPQHASAGRVLKAGEQSAFGSDTVQAVQPLDISATTWENGMLLAQHMRLADLLDELGRYRHGVLRCHASVAGLTVSGAFPLRDTDASLRLLQDTLPVKVSSLTGYWVTLEPR